MKLGQIYDMSAMSRFCDAQSHTFSDSESGTILARQLTAVNPKIFEKKFPELAFINAGIQADNTGGFAAKIQSLRLVEQGGFKTAGDASGNRGKIGLAGEDSYLTVIERQAESTWTDTEVKQADLGGVNLPMKYIQTHNKIYMRELDEIGRAHV